MTRIDGHNPLATSRLGQGNPAEAARADGTQQKDANGLQRPDLANISSRGRFVAEAIHAVQSSPDVRADKVAALKQAIAEGAYHSNAREIAQRLIAGGTFGEETL